ncbi:POT-type proton-dependent oligopeptide transporter [Sediminibacterium soli]|uniref:POT-type proton-dependent oligopeptide transporter n=1 Tax=Sediminibacterium soli TaxID=2698829 RepID=UPI00137B82AA|nr:MFS transporter [Sediminibacterium soli]NCI47571.1 POT family MFS transporter [Sediminibacterium soli]
MAETQTEVQKTGMPRSVPYIIGNEIAERFSFYGLRSIMVTYMAVAFFNPALNPALTAEADARANEMAHMFVTLAYFMPLLGAIMADWFFGKFKVILFVSILYTFGHFILSVSGGSYTLFSTGLIVIACCAGGIKSCVSANVGDQFDKSNEHLLSKVYGWFYMAINTGGTLAPLFIPLLKEKYGPDIAFGVPGILMAIATIIFWLGRKKFKRVPPAGIKRENFVTISFYALIKVFRRKPGQKVWEAVGEKYSAESIDGIKAVYRVLAVFAFTPIFWALWDQNLSEWVLQATRLDLTITGDFKLLPEQVNFVNPLFLVLLIPVFNSVIFPFLEKRGIRVTPLRKIGGGMVIIGVCFVIIALLQGQIDAGGKPSVWWQILAYVLLAASEILVSVTCLEYAYTHSPKSMKSTMSALYLLGISAGNLLTGLINSNIADKGFFSQFTGAKYYWLFIGMLVFFIVLFLLVSSRLPEKRYVGEGE